MSPVFDHALMFHSTGNITGAGGYCANAVIIHGTPVNGLSARLHVPTTLGTTLPILPQIYVSDDDSTYYLAATYPGGAQSVASGAYDLVFSFDANKKYAKMHITITSGTTGTSLVAPIAGIVEQVGYDWDRSVNFE